MQKRLLHWNGEFIKEAVRISILAIIIAIGAQGGNVLAATRHASAVLPDDAISSAACSADSQSCAHDQSAEERRDALFPQLDAREDVSASPAQARQGETTQFANLFAFKACRDGDPVFCPNGQFDQQAFAEMFSNPDGNAQHYPPGGTGDYSRRLVPMCENEACADDLIRCTDGTRPLYHYKPGTGAHADKWIIKIQGGGDTCGDRTCASGYLTNARDDFSSAYGRNQAMMSARGILSARPDNLFRDYNLVILDKCVGDRNLGDATVADYSYAADASGPLYFHGFRIVKALLQSLKTQPGTAPDLESASLIAFMTNSNGSNGGYLYIDGLHQYILDEVAAPGHVPDVRYLAGSFVYPGPEVEYAFSNSTQASAMFTLPSARSGSSSTPGNYRGIRGHVDAQTTSTTICGNGFDPAAPSYQDWLDEGRKVDGGKLCHFGAGADHLRGIGGMFFSTEDYRSGREAGYLALWGANDGTPTIDASCLEAHSATGDVEACNDSLHVMLYHMTTSTFFGAQMGDRNLRTTRLASWTTTFDPSHCDDGDPDCHGENYRGDTDYLDNPRPSEGSWQKEDFRQRVLAILHERFNGRSVHREPVQGAGHGAFVDNTVEHMGFSQISKLRRTMRPSREADALELQHYLRLWLDPNNHRPVVCVDEGDLYDVEFAPPVLMEGAPQGLVCDSGYYFDPATPIDPEQRCNDPYDNIASTGFSCLAQPSHNLFMPLMSTSASTSD